VKSSTRFAVVRIRWLPLPIDLNLPTANRVPLTGYREHVGPADLFSVYLERKSTDLDNDGRELGRVFALSDSMVDRLPTIGTRFILTAGTTPVAECTTVAEGAEAL
jgi:hypothetical protein